MVRRGGGGAGTDPAVVPTGLKIPRREPQPKDILSASGVRHRKSSAARIFALFRALSFFLQNVAFGRHLMPPKKRKPPDESSDYEQESLPHDDSQRRQRKIVNQRSRRRAAAAAGGVGRSDLARRREYEASQAFMQRRNERNAQRSEELRNSQSERERRR
jgi:hypothetical protein